MKLTKRQREVSDAMRDGWELARHEGAGYGRLRNGFAILAVSAQTIKALLKDKIIVHGEREGTLQRFKLVELAHA